MDGEEGGGKREPDELYAAKVASIYGCDLISRWNLVSYPLIVRGISASPPASSCRPFAPLSFSVPRRRVVSANLDMTMS